jgi:hypothetical protein
MALLGCAAAAWECVLALDGAAAGEDAAADVADAGWLVPPADAAVLCGADVAAAVGVEDDPQAVSSRASDPSPAAAAHRLLRMSLLTVPATRGLSRR